MSERVMSPVVAAAMVDATGRVLLQRRPEGKPLAGLWEFPGGKVERGEAPEAALIRELGEELGIGVAADALIPAGFATEVLPDRHLLLMLYIVRTWTGAPRPYVAAALRWEHPCDMANLPMPPADPPLVRQLAACLAWDAAGIRRSPAASPDAFPA